MLPEKIIIKLSLIIIVFGLSGLYLISLYVEPELTNINEIDKSFAGKVVRTEGTISKVFLHDSSTLFLNLKENEELQIIKFNAEENNLAKQDRISVTGEVVLHKGKLEILQGSAPVRNLAAAQVPF